MRYSRTGCGLIEQSLQTLTVEQYLLSFMILITLFSSAKGWLAVKTERVRNAFSSIGKIIVEPVE